jgi:WD40 repeat protein
MNLNILIFLLFIVSRMSAQLNDMELLRLVIPNGHNAPVMNVHHDSISDIIISTSYDNKVIIWEYKSRRELLTFNGHIDLITSICHLGCGKLIASADVDNNFLVWDFSTKDIVYSTDRIGVISSIVSIPECGSAFLSSDNGYIYEFDAKSNSLIDSIQIFSSNAGQVTTKYFHADKVFFSYGEFSSEIVGFSLVDKKVKRFNFNSDSQINELIFDEKEDYLIVLDNSNTIHKININNSVIQSAYSTNQSKINSICKIDSNLYAVANSNGEVIIFDRFFDEMKRMYVAANPSVFVSPTFDADKLLIISQSDKYVSGPGQTPICTSIVSVADISADSICFSREFHQPFTNIHLNDALTNAFAGSDDYFIFCLNLQTFENSILEGKTDYFSENMLVLNDQIYFESEDDDGAFLYENEICKLVYDYDGALLLNGLTTDSLYRDAFFNIENRYINYAGISNDGEFIYTITTDANDRDYFKIYKTASKKRVFELKCEKGEYFTGASFSSSKSFVYVLNSDQILVYDLKNYRLVDKLKTSASIFLSTIDVSEFDGTIAFAGGRHLFLYDEKLNQQEHFNFENEISDVNFIKSGNYLLVSSDDGFVTLLRKPFNGYSKRLKMFDGRINEALFDKNEEFLLVKGFDDNLCRLVSLRDMSVIFDFIEFFNGGHFMKLPNSPYYMCSKDASKMLHYVTPSLKVIGFDQLDPVYNRPDIVLDSIGKYFGGADQELVASYRLAWEKRMEKLGLKKELLATGEIAVPNAEIVNAEQIEYQNKDGMLIVHVKANDLKYHLQRYNVLVNEVPVYGSAGISIAGLHTQTWERTDTITLSKGRNKIQVSVMNELGLENFKYPTYVNYTPKEELASKTMFIGIGVNHFNEPAHDLKYCVKDVQDLANEFSRNQTLVDTLLLTNKEVTRESVLALRDYLMNNTTVSDKVIISCSSHGLLDDSLNFYLAMHDVDFRNPKARGLKYEELESLLDGIPARQKLLLLDACNSGENDKTELLKMDLKQKSSDIDTMQLMVARGVILEMEEENQNNFTKMNELFVNVRNNTGSVIISAAGGQQSALEAIEVNGQKIENGAFTFSVLEYLKQRDGHKIKVTELKQYTEKRVEEITGGKQKPTSRQETMEVDFFIWE